MTNDNRQPPDDLEQWIARQLQALPVRRAPSGVTTNVLAELQRRAALPWWRKSFLHWPWAARFAFIATCLALSNVSIAVMRWLSSESGGVQLSAVLSRPVSWTERCLDVVQGIQAFSELLLRHLPVSWLCGGLLAIGLMYVVLFGIGTAAYRTLYAQR
jgi:hypothetical protein